MGLRAANVAVFLLGVAACSGQAPPSAVPLPPSDLATMAIQPVTVPAERELDGTVEAVNQATVAAQTSGRVAEIFFDVNDAIPAGAVVLKIRSAEQRAALAQAEAVLKETTARTKETETRFERIRDLYQRQVVPRARFDEITAERDAAVARLAGARAALDAAREGVAYTEVQAPYAFVMTARLVRVGEAVSPGTPLFRGFSGEKLRVIVEIPQSVVEQVRRLKKAAVHVAGRRIEAGEVTISPEADQQVNSFRTRVELPANVAGLHPGMVVKARFVTGEVSRLLVPRSAVITRSEVTGVYVVGEDQRVSLRQVRLGQVFPGDHQGDRVEVLAGLGAGELVALDPAAAARAVGPGIAPGIPGDAG